MYDCDKIVINKSSVTESIFNLETGIAGEILQKYNDYNMKRGILSTEKIPEDLLEEIKSIMAIYD